MGRNIDLSVEYLGLRLKNPLVASASPMSRTLDAIRRLEDAGAGAVVMYSLFEEQIIQDDLFPRSGSPNVETALAYFPRWESEPVGPQEYVDQVALAKRSVAIPIIASLNGISPGNWTRYAQMVAQAGADALEINPYYLPVDPDLRGEDVERMYEDIVREVTELSLLPIAVKIVPFFSSLPHLARRLVRAGADGLVLFNRFYQPDLDIETGQGVPRLSYSDSEDIRLPLHGVAVLKRAGIAADLALTSGVHTHQDALKAILAGANVVMMASELLQRGPGRIREILSEMTLWLEEHGHERLVNIRGTAARPVAEPAAWERARYIRTLRSAENLS